MGFATSEPDVLGSWDRSATRPFEPDEERRPDMLNFKDTIEIPLPIVSPSGHQVKTKEEVERVWATFVEPMRHKDELTAEDRLLMAILRSVRAGFDPEGTGWGPLRRAHIEAEKELSAELAAEKKDDEE